MARKDKAGSKSGWRKRDAAYRQEQSQRRRANIQRKAGARLVDFMTGRAA